MGINFFFEDIKKTDFKRITIKNWILKCIKKYNKSAGNINFIFCSDSYLIEINKKYLNHDYYTDIITFDYCEGEIINGDIYISAERVKENAKDLNENFNVELRRVVIHGILHLLGLKDATKDEKSGMREAEDLCLKNYS